jgi:hypothetical protein
VTLPAFQLFGIAETHAHRRRDGAGVDQREPAERDDAEQELGGFPRGRILEPELGADRSQGFLPGGEVVHPGRRWGIAQGLALDQTDEVGTRREEVEVVGDRSRENGPRTLVAGKRPCSALPYRLPDFGQRAVQYRPIQLRFAPEEVAGRAARNSSCGANLSQTGGIVPLLGEQAFGRVEDGGSAPFGVSDAVGFGGQSTLVQEVAPCLLISKLPAATSSVNGMLPLPVLLGSTGCLRIVLSGTALMRSWGGIVRLFRTQRHAKDSRGWAPATDLLPAIRGRARMQHKSPLLQALRSNLRLQHMSRRTEEAYV